jgi:predicted DNA-binding antitoxin AbrB/MazE fold protein
MSFEGTVINGQIVLDQPLALPEGAKVKVEVRELSEAQKEWLRRLRAIASDCGVSLSNEAVSSEGIYD